MDRDAYLAGRLALKNEIKELSAIQKRDKAILRMPRKTHDDRAALARALENTGYTWKDVPTVQCAHILRRPRITAYLVVYGTIRGRISAHRPGKEYYMPTFNRYLEEAQELFNKAAKSAVTV